MTLPTWPLTVCCLQGSSQSCPFRFYQHALHMVHCCRNRLKAWGEAVHRILLLELKWSRLLMCRPSWSWSCCTRLDLNSMCCSYHQACWPQPSHVRLQHPTRHPIACTGGLQHHWRGLQHSPCHSWCESLLCSL